LELKIVPASNSRRLGSHLKLNPAQAQLISLIIYFFSLSHHQLLSKKQGLSIDFPEIFIKQGPTGLL
jgi:hypothetical protein